MTFQINITPDLLDSTSDDLSNKLYQRRLATLSIPGVGTFRHGDVITLHGSMAMKVKDYITQMSNNIIQIDNPAAPQAGFYIPNLTVPVNEPVQLIDQSTGQPNEWFWSVVKQTGVDSNNNQNPVFIFHELGNHTIDLFVSNTSGVSSLR